MLYVSNAIFFANYTSKKLGKVFDKVKCGYNLPHKMSTRSENCMCVCVCNHISLVQFSRSVVSDYLQPHGLQHARLPYPSPIPGACSNSCPSGRWCHPTISSSIVPFSSCLQSFPASGFFQWVNSLHQVAKVLEPQHQSFPWIFRTDFL